MKSNTFQAKLLSRFSLPMKIGVLMGGFSSEREISIRSGKAVFKALTDKGFRACPVEISSHDFCEAIKPGAFDFAFITLHGAGGEDGFVQSFLEKHHIPYLGSGPEASARAFNKITAKRIFERAGIPTPAFEVLEGENWKEKAEKLVYPVFIKPADEGSSIDVFCCQDPGELKKSMNGLIEKYGMVLAERKITGRELTVGIVGTRALPVVEIKPKRGFYDYQAKYDKTRGTEYVVPAVIPDAEAKRVQEIALAVHRALGLRDFSRVDLMLGDEGPYVLEANTIPGFTETSLLPKAASAIGMNFQDLCAELVRIGWERNQDEAKTQSQNEKVFSS